MMLLSDGACLWDLRLNTIYMDMTAAFNVEGLMRVFC
jgi:hypothetical protein